jgi:hypothetical protein
VEDNPVGSLSDPPGLPVRSPQRSGQHHKKCHRRWRGTETLPKLLRRFHGVVDLDALRAGRDAGKVAEEVLQHLAGQVGSNDARD